MIGEAKQMMRDLHAVQQIANLQGRYLYYTQSHEYERVLSLFALDDPAVSVEISSTGVYVGAEKIRALFLELFKPLFTSAGSLPIHLLTTPVIEIAENGQSAVGIWQTLVCNAFPGKDGLVAMWQQGKYDNEFVCVEGRWLLGGSAGCAIS